jgi:hypothetical protein
MRRIRWIPVVTVLCIVAMIALIIVYFPSRYAVSGKVAVSVDADPSKIQRGESATIEVEVKNLDKSEEKTINIEAVTFDDSFLFTDTDSKKAAKQDIAVGPQETREIKFKVKASSDALLGKYRVDVTAREKLYSEGAKDTVYIRVLE